MKKISVHVSTKTSRRTFVKRAALGAGVAALSFGRAPYSAWGKYRGASQRKLGVALVGLGYYSTDVLAPALQETRNCMLAGIVTGTPSKAEAWAARYNIPSRNVYNYDSFDQMADNPEIDIVYVVLPNSMHAAYSIRAARAGKHVICEKPMAVTVAECEAMIAACRQADRRLSIGYRLHFEPHTQEVMRLGQERVYGPVKMITAGAGYTETRADHWKVKKEMGGGAMMDMGVYSLQAARYVTGEEPVSVTAQTFTTRPEMFENVDETTTFQLQFPSGAVANLHTSFGVNMNYLQANAEKGWFRLDPFSSYGGIKGESKDGPIAFAQINQQAAQMDEVAYGIINGEPMRVPGEEGLRDMRVVEGVYRSIRTGEKVSLL